MNEENLPAIINDTQQMLDRARTSAEVLEVRDQARMAYAIAKEQSRMEKASRAHADICNTATRLIGAAALLEARANIKLAEEYDAAKDKGEVAVAGSNQHSNEVVVNANDLGIRRDQIHHARKLRDAELESPGILDRTVNDLIERGEEPTKAAIMREVLPKQKPVEKVNEKGLQLWGTLRDMEKDLITENPDDLMKNITEGMTEDIKRLAPIVSAYLKQFGD